MLKRPTHLAGLVALAACGVLLSALPAAAEIYIDVGKVMLRPDTPGQRVLVRLTTDAADRVAGCNFNAEIGDAGSAFGGIDGPAITAVDMEIGTIFAGNNRGQTDLGSLAQLATYSIVTDSGTVAAEGLLATLTIDTTGFTTPGATWKLELDHTLNGPTDFAPLHAIISDGTITLIPEPASMALLGCGALSLLVRRRGRRPWKA
jgi:hypothetical protein